MDSYNIFSTRTTMESIAQITSQDSFSQSVKTPPDTFQPTMPRKREKSQESFYSIGGTSKPMESFHHHQHHQMPKANTLSRHHVKTIEVPRVPDTYSKTLNRSKSKERNYEPFMFRTQQQQQQPHLQSQSPSSEHNNKTSVPDKNDLLPDLSEAGYMITEL